jgi:hypothetical protein
MQDHGRLFAIQAITTWARDSLCHVRYLMLEAVSEIYQEQQLSVCTYVFQIRGGLKIHVTRAAQIVYRHIVIPKANGIVELNIAVRTYMVNFFSVLI